MKFISDRISISESQGNVSIIISPDYDARKQKFLTVWLLLWTLGGLVIFTQLFGEYTKDEKLFFSAWLAFWLYFEIVGINAFLWKKKGFERLSLKNNNVYYYKGKSKPKVFEMDMINDLEVCSPSEKSLLANLSDSYWNQGSETIQMGYKGKSFKFGFKLSKSEALSLTGFLKKKVKI
jgi:hypothetical protein